MNHRVYKQSQHDICIIKFPFQVIIGWDSLERCEYPMLAEVLNRITSQPLRGAFLHTSHEVQDKELVFQNKIVPIWDRRL